jgi:DNA-binding transcriptional ArsR family regulator
VKPDAKQRLEELDRVMTALAHPSRRQILLVVRFRGGAMTSGEIAARFHHAWPTVSRHLGVLVEAGVLTSTRQGRTRVYRLEQRTLDVVREWLRWFDDEALAQMEPVRTARRAR